MKRRNVLKAALAGLSAAPGVCSYAQVPAGRPLTLVVPFAPGGNLDVVARTIAPGLARALNTTVIVDNRAGAGGALGAAFVAKADPDGRTLLVSTPNALVVLPQLVKVNYTLASFRPVAQVSTTPLVMVVNANSRFKTIVEVLEYARLHPGEVSAGHAGLGTTNHVALLQLEEAAKVKLNPIAYKGSAPALVDLIGGQIDLVVDQLTSSAPQIQAGSVRALAVMSAARERTLPNVQTLREAGLSEFDATTATGILVPAATPVAVAETLSAGIRQALDEPTVKARLLALGSPASPSSPQEWQFVLQREDLRAQELARTGKLK